MSAASWLIFLLLFFPIVSHLLFLGNSPPPLPTNPQVFLSMVLSLSLVIMVQITGSGEAPQLGRGGDQALQAGLCQQGRQPAAADRAQGEAAVSTRPVFLPDCQKHSSHPSACLQSRVDLQAAAGDGPEDRETVEADVRKGSGQRERHGGSAQHEGHADQRAEEGKALKTDDGAGGLGLC